MHLDVVFARYATLHAYIARLLVVTLDLSSRAVLARLVDAAGVDGMVLILPCAFPLISVATLVSL